MKSPPDGPTYRSFLPPRRVAALVLAVLASAAIFVRFHGLNDPLVTYHPTRHYRSAVIARSMYYEGNDAVPPWARTVADNNRAMQPAGEPPFFEWGAAASYRLLEREDIRVPRAASALFWVLGVWPLYLVGRRLSGPLGALSGATVYLFLPYAIVGTRSFQPDALMTCCILWSLFAMVRHHEAPSASRRYTAALLIALALLVKPMSVFLTVPVLLGLAAGRWRGLRAIFDREFLVVLVLGVAPAGLYYGYGALFGSLVKDQFGMRFVPSLLTTPFFWEGVLTQLRGVYGLPVFLAGVAGLCLTPGGDARRLLVAMWTGYVAFGIAFTYHIATHDYYHLPYVAVLALSIAALVERVRQSARLRDDSLVLLLATIVLVGGFAAWGSRRALPQLSAPDSAERVAAYERIGELTHHDSRVLFLDVEYGYALMYHGQLSGDYWPNADDLAAENMGKLLPITAHDRFARDYVPFNPTYFVVTDLWSLKVQTDLQQLLAERAVVVEEAPGYKVLKFLASSTSP